LNIDPFDRLIGAIMVALILAIAVVVALGNNVGVRVESYAPQQTARNDSTIRIRFFDLMQTDTVESRFSVTPPLKGELKWVGQRELVFTPAQALASGETYTVRLERGAQSRGGTATLKEALVFSFRVRLPRVLYLAPATSQRRNLYLQDLNTGEIRQLTDLEWGLADYAVSPDGQYLAYTAYTEAGTSDIWLYSLATGAVAQLTNCVNASCGAPTWRPDGTQIAYEREEYDVALGQVGARRVWLVDVLSAQSALLFADTQITGHSPRFSPTGNRLAMFSTNPPGILIYDFVAENRVFIENLQGVVGDFSPDGHQLVYPILVRGVVGETFYSQLELVDLLENRRQQVTGTPEIPIEDTSAVWRPTNGRQLVVARRYLDNRYTEGAQAYLLDLETAEVSPLVVDAAYSHGDFHWSPDGGLLVMQRFNRVTPGARPEIWLYNMTTQDLTQLAQDAYFPSCIP
jgi:Tol biopolymer transport system component